jgi:hypothetical protein
MASVPSVPQMMIAKMPVTCKRQRHGNNNHHDSTHAFWSTRQQPAHAFAEQRKDVLASV